MNTNITERDKKLLYGLGIIVIVALFFIIAIRPLSKSINAKQEKIEEEQITHDVMQTKIQYNSVVQAYVETMTKNVEEKSKRYYKVMDSSAVDRIFTNYALDHSLVVSNLSISMPEETVLFGPYPYSESYKLQEQRVA
ncbi:MAG: type II secretion system protein M, partial [Lachnospiraceae bacterium]|nr:type II secretion system protein M [Lachnospiraceae bacterium]